METFVLDKSFYDIGSAADELKELWEADDLDPSMQEAVPPEWCLGLAARGAGVVLRDRLMTDAALGGGGASSGAPTASHGRPVAADHSYSLASDGDSTRGSPPPPSPGRHRDDDMENECFPAISVRTACGRPSNRRMEEDEDIDVDLKECVQVKDEPLSEDTESVQSSYPSSPLSVNIKSERDDHDHIDVEMTSPPPHTATILHTLSGGLFLTSPHTVIPPSRLRLPAGVRIGPNGTFHRLPPTPPSCSSSDDSEDNATMLVTASPRKTTKRDGMQGVGRQPIHTPLISNQPKGSTGMLVLTEEEKRTLIAEGYPVPTRLPLTKAEEKSLKKIRRKIKNKISAQESRRKKKEYMDQLEKKVEILVSENNDYKMKIDNLESSNNNLLNELQKLRAIVAKTHPQVAKLK